ncbi:hypothetical protein RDABS01_038205 [Bienertia sinuspersici]
MAGKIPKSTATNGDKPSDDVSPQTLTITDDLITEEILPRLPVKSLTRFKLVCKKWNSTISSDEFAKLHLKFSSSSSNTYNNRYLIIFPHENKVYGKQNDDCYCLTPFREVNNVKDLVRLEGGIGDVDWHYIVDSCNGLVCLYQRDDNEDERKCFFTIWNPATGEDWDVPSPQEVHVSKAYGFGYVPCVEDYMIVASFGSGTVDGSMFRGLYVFSVKALKWDKVCGSFEYLRMSRWCWRWRRVVGGGGGDQERIAKGLEGEAIVVGDTMYWCSKYFVGRRIVGFDLVSKKLVEYPRLDCQCGYNSLELFRVKGCLSLLGGGGKGKNNNVSDFWMLKNPDDWSSWQKILSVDLTDVSLLTFSETGKCLVRQGEELKLVDPCKEALECTKGNGADSRGYVITKDHVESLISPFGITKVDEDEDESSITSGFRPVNFMYPDNLPNFKYLSGNMKG